MTAQIIPGADIDNPVSRNEHRPVLHWNTGHWNNNFAADCDHVCREEA